MVSSEAVSLKSAAPLTGYDFSSFFPVSTYPQSPALVFSPGSTFFLTSVGNRLILRQSTTLTVAQSWLCGNITTSLTHLAFSHDTAYVLAVSLKLGLCWVFGLGDGDEPLAVIKAGPEGITRAEFGMAPHRREVFVWSDHGLRIAIHDLSAGQSTVILNPKSTPGSVGHCFTSTGMDFILLEYHNGKTVVGVYSTAGQGPYKLMHHFTLPYHPVSLALSPATSKPHLLLPHPVLSPAGYRFEVYNPLGIHIGAFGWQDESFQLENGKERVDPGTGIRCARWGPGGKWVGVGGTDGKVRIVEVDGWRCVKTFAYHGKGKRGQHEIPTWREPAGWYKDTRGQGIVQFDPVAAPATIPTLKTDLSSPSSKQGIASVEWNQDGTLFYARLDSQPTAIHIHSFLPSPEDHTPRIDRIAQIELSAPIKAVGWSTDPKRPKRIAIVTGGGAVYFLDGGEEWESGAIAEAVGIPGGSAVAAVDLVWSPDGQSLAIVGKEQYCVVYDSIEEEPTLDDSFVSA